MQLLTLLGATFVRPTKECVERNVDEGEWSNNW